MMRIVHRRVALVVACVGLAAAGFAGTASAATPPPPAAGTINCLLKGSIKFVPPLLGYEGHAVNSSTVTLATSEYGCTGTGDAGNILKGSSKTSHISDSNDCATVLQQPLVTDGSESGPLKWTVARGTQKWAASTITLTGSTKSGDGVSTPFTIDSTGSSLAGSFSGNSLTSHVQIKNTLASIVKACSNTDPLRGGLKSLTFVAGGTFALS